jgi:serine/threonine protein kinase/tetratricopeptide (TPR) repeat protein
MAVKLGPFVVGEQLATGGMGEVRAATHAPSGLPVAIKLIRRDRLDDHAVAEFESEVRAQARIDHPGVVYLFDHGRLDVRAAKALDLSPGMPWLAMEHCSSSLFEVGPGLRWKGVRQVLLQLLDALAHAHAVGVLHRDIKLGNVLVSTAADLRPGVKLADFGIAHALADDDEETRSIGTPRYMAPEQVRGEWEFHGPWTDLYALGVLAWRLLTGRRPWPRLDGIFLARAMCSMPIGWPGARFPVPPGAQGWVERMTAKEPWKRYQLAADAAAGLRELPAEVEDASWAPAGRSLVRPRAMTLVPGDEDVEQPVPRPRAPVVNPQDDPPAESEASIRLHMAGIGLLPLRRPAFIGRRRERRVAWESLRRVAQRGRPAALCVVGPERIGRTRFLQWLGEAAERVGQAVCVPIVCKPDRPLSVSVLRSLRHWFRVGSLTADAASRHLGSWLGDGPWLADFAALLVRGEADDEGWIHTVVHGLAALGRLRPAVVRVEGTRWAPEAAILVRALLAEEHAPLLVVVDAEIPGLPSLTLGPLGETSMHRLANAFVALDPDVRSRLVDRAAGSPGFLVMTLVHWGTMGLLREGRQGFVVKAEDALPPTLAVVATARLHAVVASLPEGGIEALERALLLEDPFSLEDWAGVDGWGRDDVRSEVVRVLADRGLLTGTPAAYAIPSVPFREAVLANAGPRLADHHARCAAHLERQVPVDSLALGRHRLAAGDVEGSLEPLRRGLVQLTSTRGAAAGLPVAGPLEDAVVQLSGPARIRWTAILDELRAGMLIDVGQLEPAEENARSSLRTAEVLGDQDLAARSWARLGAVAARRGADAERIRCFRKALDVQSQVEVGTVASWWMELAKAHLSVGDRRNWGTCMAAAGSTSLARGRTTHIHGLGEAAQLQLEGRIDAALSALDDALAAASASGSAMARLSVLRARAHTLLECGEPRAARRIFEEALELALRLRTSRVPVLLANVVALDFQLEERRTALDRYDRHRFVLPAGNDGAEALVPAHCVALAATAMAQDWRKVTYHFDRVQRHGRWSWAAQHANAALIAVTAERVRAKRRPRLAAELVRYGLQRAGPLGDHPARQRLLELGDDE